MSNLKQIGTALFMYADDYDGWFPNVLSAYPPSQFTVKRTPDSMWLLYARKYIDNPNVFISPSNFRASASMILPTGPADFKYAGWLHYAYAGGHKIGKMPLTGGLKTPAVNRRPFNAPLVMDAAAFEMLSVDLTTPVLRTIILAAGPADARSFQILTVTFVHP